MTNHLLPFTFFGVSLLFLALRLFTGKKREFIISMFFVVLGTVWFTVEVQIELMYYFCGAILLSFIGDLLMAQWIRITEQRTIDGIMMFGIAHIVYILAFNRLNFTGFSIIDNWYLVLIGLIVGIVLFLVVGNKDELHIAIKVSNAIYALIITSLLVVVMGFVFSPEKTLSLLPRVTAGIGILLFVISDSVLAYNEFQKEIPHAKEIIAVTYILAQILLVSTAIITYIL